MRINMRRERRGETTKGLTVDPISSGGIISIPHVVGRNAD
jgi:hypothetical protein